MGQGKGRGGVNGAGNAGKGRTVIRHHEMKVQMTTMMKAIGMTRFHLRGA